MTAPIPMDLIERLNQEEAYALAHLAPDLQPGPDDEPPHTIFGEASLALSQAQERIGELEAELREHRQDSAIGAKWGENPVAWRARGKEAEARAQAAEGLLKEAGEVVRGQLLVMRLAALKFDFSLDDSASTEAAVAFLLKLSPGEGGGSDGIPEPSRLGEKERHTGAEPSAAGES